MPETHPLDATHPAIRSRKRGTERRSQIAHNRLGGMIWAVWHASRQTARTPVELIESTGWFPFRVPMVDATVFTRSEWKE